MERIRAKYLHIIESKVAQNLDDYIENQGEYLMRLSIQTLYNIFSNKNKKFTKHDRTYQDSNIFILLKFIDGQKIGIGHLTDSILNSEQRFGYMPNFDLSFINENQKLKEKNEKQDEVIQELKKNCEEQNKEIERLTNDIQKVKESQEKESKELRDLIHQIKSQNDQLQGELISQKERQDIQQKSIDELEKSEKTSSLKQESNEKLIEEQSNKIKELELSISKMKNDVENLKKLQSEMDESNLTKCPNGFFKYLFDKYNSNPANNGIINISANWCNSGEKEKIIESNWSNYYNSKNEPNSFIKIDYLIKINKYKHDIGDRDNNHLFTSWTLKGTTNKMKKSSSMK